MICPVCKKAEMKSVEESSPLNVTLKCLNCGAEAMEAAMDESSDEKRFQAVFVKQPDGSMKEVNLND